jgi:hypothetical protein
MDRLKALHRLKYSCLIDWKLTLANLLKFVMRSTITFIGHLKKIVGTVSGLAEIAIPVLLTQNELTSSET